MSNDRGKEETQMLGGGTACVIRGSRPKLFYRWQKALFDVIPSIDSTSKQTLAIEEIFSRDVVFAAIRREG